MTASVLQAALFYGARAVPLHPPDGSSGCSVKQRGKAPMVANWTKLRMTPDSIRAHWAQHPKANLGVLTGGGLVVLDIDPRHGGDEALRRLEKVHGDLPETVTCETGGGGLHLYFQGPPQLPSFDLADGLEVKSNGKQVVVPPSVHPETGQRYAWRDGYRPKEIQRAPLPEWLMRRPGVGPDGRAVAKPADFWARLLVEGVDEGFRHNDVPKVVGWLARYWYGDPAAVRELALMFNRTRVRPPLDERQIVSMADKFAAQEAHKRASRRGAVAQ